MSEQTRDRFARLADLTGRPMTQLLPEAADALSAVCSLISFATRYEELRADSAAWSETEAERAVESGAIGDRWA